MSENQTLCMLTKLHLVLSYAPYTPTYPELRADTMRDVKELLEVSIGQSLDNFTDDEILAHFCKEG